MRKRPPSCRRAALAGIIVVAALLGGVAVAAGPDDRATAESIVKEVESSPRKDAAGEMLQRSRAALARGAKLRAGGDEAHARLADGLARTWAEAARDVVRAIEVEERAGTARRAATDAGVVADRERALLEEGVAQSGRLRAQLEATQRSGKEQPVRTSTSAAAAPTGDAGAAGAAKDGGAK